MTAPVKPSFVNYCADHFKYYGTLQYFLEQMDQVSIECCCDLSYNKQTYEFEVLAYPTDQKILYAIQIYSEPKTNCHIIEFRRLDGPGFVYRNHIMSVWTALNKRNIGPGVSSNARPMMPTLNMESLDEDDDDDDEKVQPATLLPILEMVVSDKIDVSRTGLQMLISATKATATKDALRETKAMTTVIDVAFASNNVEIDRCIGVVLREGVFRCYDGSKDRLIELVKEKLNKSLQNKNIEILEVQRKYIDLLDHLLFCYTSVYIDIMRRKGVVVPVRHIMNNTKCKRLETIARKVENEIVFHGFK